jgi:multisubunit Na+/H+ antiporter MnhG subunit
VQPREGALHDPAFFAQPGAVLGAASGDHGLHAALAQFAAVLIVVIAPVSEHPLGTLARTPGLTGDRTDAVDQRQ